MCSSDHSMEFWSGRLEPQPLEPSHGLLSCVTPKPGRVALGVLSPNLMGTLGAIVLHPAPLS